MPIKRNRKNSMVFFWNFGFHFLMSHLIDVADVVKNIKPMGIHYEQLSKLVLRPFLVHLSPIQ